MQNDTFEDSYESSNTTKHKKSVYLKTYHIRVSKSLNYTLHERNAKNELNHIKFVDTLNDGILIGHSNVFNNQLNLILYFV